MITVNYMKTGVVPNSRNVENINHTQTLNNFEPANKLV
jgi:hypothetical protein